MSSSQAVARSLMARWTSTSRMVSLTSSSAGTGWPRFWSASRELGLVILFDLGIGHLGRGAKAEVEKARQVELLLQQPADRGLAETDSGAALLEFGGGSELFLQLRISAVHIFR